MQAIFNALIALFQLFAMPENQPVSLPESRATDTRDTATSQAIIASLSGYQATGYHSMSGDTRHANSHAHPHE